MRKVICFASVIALMIFTFSSNVLHAAAAASAMDECKEAAAGASTPSPESVFKPNAYDIEQLSGAIEACTAIQAAHNREPALNPDEYQREIHMPFIKLFKGLTRDDSLALSFPIQKAFSDIPWHALAYSVWWEWGHGDNLLLVYEMEKHLLSQEGMLVLKTTFERMSKGLEPDDAWVAQSKPIIDILKQYSSFFYDKQILNDLLRRYESIAAGELNNLKKIAILRMLQVTGEYNKDLSMSALKDEGALTDGNVSLLSHFFKKTEKIREVLSHINSRESLCSLIDQVPEPMWRYLQRFMLTSIQPSIASIVTKRGEFFTPHAESDEAASQAFVLDKKRQRIAGLSFEKNSISGLSDSNSSKLLVLDELERIVRNVTRPASITRGLSEERMVVLLEELLPFAPKEIVFRGTDSIVSKLKGIFFQPPSKESKILKLSECLASVGISIEPPLLMKHIAPVESAAKRDKTTKVNEFISKVMPGYDDENLRIKYDFKKKQRKDLTAFLRQPPEISGADERTIIKNFAEAIKTRKFYQDGMEEKLYKEFTGDSWPSEADIFKNSVRRAIGVVACVRDQLGIHNTIDDEIYNPASGFSGNARTLAGRDKLKSLVIAGTTMLKPILAEGSLIQMMSQSTYGWQSIEFLIGYGYEGVKSIFGDPSFAATFKKRKQIRNFYDHPDPSRKIALILWDEDGKAATFKKRKQIRNFYDNPDLSPSQKIALIPWDEDGKMTPENILVVVRPDREGGYEKALVQEGARLLVMIHHVIDDKFNQLVLEGGA